MVVIKYVGLQLPNNWATSKKDSRPMKQTGLVIKCPYSTHYLTWLCGCAVSKSTTYDQPTCINLLSSLCIVRFYWLILFDHELYWSICKITLFTCLRNQVVGQWRKMFIIEFRRSKGIHEVHIKFQWRGSKNRSSVSGNSIINPAWWPNWEKEYLQIFSIFFNI